MPEDKVKATPPSKFDYTFMSLAFKFRDMFRPRSGVVRDAGIKAGDCVLDYGCGPGGYVLPVHDIIGDKGMLYALDIQPLAIAAVDKIIAGKGLKNVKTIHSDCATGLPPGSIDVVLLYDILHHLAKPAGIFEELHRVLKNEGILSVTDHHLKKEAITSIVTGGGFFSYQPGDGKTQSFVKAKK